MQHLRKALEAGDRGFKLMGRHTNEFIFALFQCPQPLLHGPAFRNLGFKRVCLLLQQRNGKQALVRAGKRGIALIRDDTRMLSTNLGELRPVSFPVKAVHGIGTEEREGLEVVLQFVPEFFQADGSRRMPLHPEQRDHFPKDAHMTATLRRSRDQFPYDFSKALRIRPSIDHKLR